LGASGATYGTVPQPPDIDVVTLSGLTVAADAELPTSSATPVTTDAANAVRDGRAFVMRKATSLSSCLFLSTLAGNERRMYERVSMRNALRIL
jgi:hypothetical protein